MRLLAAISAALALCAPAFAADPCKTKGSIEAQFIDTLPAPSDTAFYKALAAATQPDTTAKAMEASRACTREPIGMSGENKDAFPRIYRTGPRIGYLAPLPLKQPDGKSKTVYAVVFVWGSGAVRIGGLLDGIPEDRLLGRILLPDYKGGFEPLEFDAGTRRIVDKNAYLPLELKRAAGRHNDCLRTPGCGTD